MVTTTLRQTKSSASSEYPAGNMIPLDSIYNLRHIDAHGKLFRSARQDWASPEDLQHLSNLGIRTFLDFRTSMEYKKHKSRAMDSHHDIQVLIPKCPNPKTRPYPSSCTISMKDLNGKPVRITEPSPKTRRRYLINMLPNGMFLEIFNMAPLYKRLLSLLLIIVDYLLGTRYKYFIRCLSDEINGVGTVGWYVSILKHGGKQLCFTLKTISNSENLPALLCCAHGKDRTGLVTAMILSILGKSDEYIAEDYALSEKGLKSILATVQRETTVMYKLDESFAMAKKETMLKTLAVIRDRYGSVENYLESIGFGRDDQERLRQVLS